MLHIILKVYDCSVQVAYALISNSQRLAAAVVFFLTIHIQQSGSPLLSGLPVSLIILWDHWGQNQQF